MKHLILLVPRSSSTRPLAVIDPARYDEAFQALINAPESLEVRTFLAVLLSCGCSVTEGLALRRCDLYLLANVISRVHRDQFTLHPKLLRAWLDKSKPKHFEKIFKLSPSTIDRALKRLLGPHGCPQSLRRSFQLRKQITEPL